MKTAKTALFVLAVFLVGCKTPPAPPEVRASEIQEQDLWRAGASVYAGQEYADYVRALQTARQEFVEENRKLGWFRDYDKVAGDFRSAMNAGEALGTKVRAMKTEKASAINAAAAAVREKISLLKNITLSLTERGKARKQLAQAEVLIAESASLAAADKFEEASRRVASAADCCRDAEEAVIAFIGRYLDPQQIVVWRKWTAETIAESRKNGTVALVVSKLERRLTVYKGGQVFRTYDVGLGFNGLSDKLHAGDNATPEGRYFITRKFPATQYYKALLINYPNDEDRKRFAREKSRGSIPGSVGIGGDIEIHGGGPDSLTRGCISLDNNKMDELYNIVATGTPVTIVGTNETENYVIRAIRNKK